MTEIETKKIYRGLEGSFDGVIIMNETNDNIISGNYNKESQINYQINETTHFYIFSIPKMKSIEINTQDK